MNVVEDETRICQDETMSCGREGNQREAREGRGKHATSDSWRFLAILSLFPHLS